MIELDRWVDIANAVSLRAGGPVKEHLDVVYFPDPLIGRLEFSPGILSEDVSCFAIDIDIAVVILRYLHFAEGVDPVSTEGCFFTKVAGRHRRAV